MTPDVSAALVTAINSVAGGFVALVILAWVKFFVGSSEHSLEINLEHKKLEDE